MGWIIFIVVWIIVGGLVGLGLCRAASEGWG